MSIQENIYPDDYVEMSNEEIAAMFQAEGFDYEMHRNNEDSDEYVNLLKYKHFLSIANPSISWKTKDISKHKDQLDKLINYLAPALRYQFGAYIRKLNKTCVGMKSAGSSDTMIFNTFGHIECGQSANSTKYFKLTTCLHKYKDVWSVEVPNYDPKSWERGNYLLAASGELYLVIDIKQIDQDIKIAHGDLSYWPAYETMLKNVGLQAYDNSKNITISIESLFKQGYVKSFGFFNRKEFSGLNQFNIFLESQPIKNLKLCDTFSSSPKYIEFTKLMKLPKNFEKFKIPGASQSCKTNVFKLENIEDDKQRENKLFSNNKAAMNYLLTKSNNIKSYRAFCKAAAKASSDAINCTISQRPVIYSCKDSNGKLAHYIVLSNEVPTHLAIEYIVKVQNKAQNKVQSKVNVKLNASIEKAASPALGMYNCKPEGLSEETEELGSSFKKNLKNLTKFNDLEFKIKNNINLAPAASSTDTTVCNIEAQKEGTYVQKKCDTSESEIKNEIKSKASKASKNVKCIKNNTTKTSKSNKVSKNRQMQAKGRAKKEQILTGLAITNVAQINAKAGRI
jgi:hypothetical protein